MNYLLQEKSGKKELRYGWDAHLESSDQTPQKYLTSVYLKIYP
jgi:hypothetical protein